MAENELSREEDLRELLTDAIEVQLAALRAGISFWTDWIEETTSFVQSATASLANIKAEKDQAKDVLLELVDAGRASVRSMTEIPRNTATRFIEELDKIEKKKKDEGPRPPGSAPAPGGPVVGVQPAKRAGTKPRPKRAGRVKA